MPYPSDTVIVDTRFSPHARLHPVGIAAVRVEDHFWQPRQKLNREQILPRQYRQLEETGRLDNFRKAAGKMEGVFEGWFFNDSDVYKWLEAAAWALADRADAKLGKMIDDVIGEVAAAQQPDGYLDTYFSGERADKRWTDFGLHEMYCAGHLFQAAAAHYRATGQKTLLDVASRLADHLWERFQSGREDQDYVVDGHPEVEMALVELYRTTGEKRYLTLAEHLLDQRGQGRLDRAGTRYDPRYHQDHVPFRELQRMEGHAVRAAYLNCGAADLYAENGDMTLLQALERMWQSMVERQMYVHGGLGARWDIEGFGEDYELPNESAHAETCASIGSFMWNWRMLLLTGQARFADLMELTLYNSILSGVSLDGEAYFYQNPLGDDGNHRRQPWFECACCPPNLARTLASLNGYIYSTSTSAVWVHLYIGSSAEMPLPDGRNIRLKMETRYPWSGDIQVTVETPGRYRLNLRIPSWCEAPGKLAVNDQPVEGEMQDGYMGLEREWKVGDQVRLRLPLTPRLAAGSQRVAANRGKAAILYGPLLYCAEAVDNPLVELDRVSLPAELRASADFAQKMLDGVVIMTANACLEEPDGEPEAGSEIKEKLVEACPQPVELNLIPYFAWANRTPGKMRVWFGKGE